MKALKFNQSYPFVLEFSAFLIELDSADAYPSYP